MILLNENFLSQLEIGHLTKHLIPMYITSILMFLIVGGSIIHTSINRENLISNEQATSVKKELKKYKLMQGLSPSIHEVLEKEYVPER